jgi:hypothetical protein
MQESWRQVLRSLLADSESGWDEANVTDAEVTRYIEAILAGAEPGNIAPEMDRLLRQHPALQAELDELVAMFEADQHADPVEPLTQPTYTLAFLDQPRRTARTFPPANVTALISGLNWVVDQMGQFWFDLSQPLQRETLATGLFPTRGEPEEPQNDRNVENKLSLGPEELGDLDLEVQTIANLEQNDGINLGTLLVTARIPTRWPSQDGIEITLIYGNVESGEVERTALTDENGQVRFENFPLNEWSRSQLRVKPPPTAS